jgi:hypothetical protein
MTPIFFHPFLFMLFLDPGCVKIGIRDKHPGSATLLHCGCILKITRSLFAEELSCCDCFRVQVTRGIVPCPQ